MGIGRSLPVHYIEYRTLDGLRLRRAVEFSDQLYIYGQNCLKLGRHMKNKF